MIEYTKNENEYKFDGRYYIRQIKSCICSSRKGTAYFLFCNIHQRGYQMYQLSEKADYISDSFGKKKFWLSDEAKATVKKVIETFEKDVLFAKKNFLKVDFPEAKTTIYYKHDEKMIYEFLIEEENGDTEGVTATTFKNMIYITERIFRRIAKNMVYKKGRSFFEPMDEAALRENPLYISAVQRKDRFMQVQMKMYYKLESEEDCKWLSEKLEKRVLPRLSEEYNRDYIVDGNTVQKDLLDRSGYTTECAGWMRMMNDGNTYTRCKWTLNPCSKNAKAYAKKQQPAISFDEYLKLFE